MNKSCVVQQNILYFSCLETGRKVCISALLCPRTWHFGRELGNLGSAELQIRASMWDPVLSSGTPVLHTVCCRLLVGLFRLLRPRYRNPRTTVSDRDGAVDRGLCRQAASRRRVPSALELRSLAQGASLAGSTTRRRCSAAQEMQVFGTPPLIHHGIGIGQYSNGTFYATALLDSV